MSVMILLKLIKFVEYAIISQLILHSQLAGKENYSLVLFVLFQKTCNLYKFLSASSIASQQGSSLYQCLPNPTVPGQSWIPNIPTEYFTNNNSLTPSNLGTARFAFTYIFEIPAGGPGRSCTGNVSAIEICYRSAPDQQSGVQKLMEFFVLDKKDNSAKVTQSFPVMVNPLSATCSSLLRSCCEVVPIQNDHKFELSSSKFTFGIIITHQTIQPIVFAPSFNDFNANQYQISVGLITPTTINFQNTPLVTDNSLMMLRFALGKYTISYVL